MLLVPLEDRTIPRSVHKAVREEDSERDTEDGGGAEDGVMLYTNTHLEERCLFVGLSIRSSTSL